MDAAHRLIAVVLACHLMASCATRRILTPPHPLCWDGLPVKLLQDASCRPDGRCGWSCLPGRWEDPC